MRITPFIVGLFLIVAGIMATSPATAFGTANITIDSFNDDTVLQAPASQDNPSRYTYTSSNANAFITNVQSKTAPNSFKFSSTATLGYSNFDLTGDVCSTFTGITWWVYMPTLPATSNSDVFQLSQTPGQQTTANRVQIIINDAGAVIINYEDQTSQTVSGITMPTGTWVDFNMVGITCAAPMQATFASNTLGFFITLTSGIDSMSGVIDDFNVYHNGATQHTLYVDDVGITGSDEIVQTTPAGPVLTVVGLKGMDVDSSGTTLIARTHDSDGNTHDNVRTYSAQTLSTPGNVMDTDCNRIKGVAAMRNYVAFLECNSGAETDVDFLMIRSSTLGDPDRPGLCDGESFCVKDIDANELCGDQSAATDIALVQEFPFDYSRNRDLISPNSKRVYMAFAMALTDGTVGIATYSMNNNLDDKSECQFIGVGPSSTVAREICVWQDQDGQSYMYAAGDSQAKGFTADFDVEDTIDADEGTISVNLAEVFSGSAITASPLGVACGEGRFAVITATTLSVWNRGASSPLWTRTVASVPSAGLTMSGDGNWVSWVEGTTMKVASVEASAANAYRPAVPAGGVVATGTNPTGTFQQMDTDGTAQIVWVATDVRIQAFNQVYKLTTGNATACNPGDVGCGGSTTNTATGSGSDSGGGLLGLDSTGSVFGTLGLVAGTALLGYALTTKRERRRGPEE